MGLPEQERFTLQNVAERLGTDVSHVEEMVCTLKFKYIIVRGEIIAGLPQTRHVYFDQDLFRERRPKLPELRDNEKKKLIAQIRSLMRNQPDRTPNAVFAKHAERRIDRIRKGIPEDYTYWPIGPNEVAVLWESKHWNRPQEEVVIYIPQVALKAFEQEYGRQKESTAEKAKKKDKSPALDPSEIRPSNWYGTAQVAKFLGKNKKYVQNNFDAIIRSRNLNARRQGRSREVQGKSLRDSMEKNDSES